MTEKTAQTKRLAREEGLEFMPRFDDNGLITAVAIHHKTREVLMIAYMNSESLQKTLDTGEAWYWSRSRKILWHKGDTSGQIQTVHEIKVDCDQDCLLLSVSVGGDGGSCHTGRMSCFYRVVKTDTEGKAYLSKSG
jgi:phosphoribosyl-AMP cyclohydrolase